MTESNYDILKISDGASKREIREAYRNLVLEIHSDRGGDDEQFKKIKQAYEDLKVGKKYADSIKVKKEKAKVFSGDSASDKRRKNLLLSSDISIDLNIERRWAPLLRGPECGRQESIPITSRILQWLNLPNRLPQHFHFGQHACRLQP